MKRYMSECIGTILLGSNPTDAVSNIGQVRLRETAILARRRTSVMSTKYTAISEQTHRRRHAMCRRAVVSVLNQRHQQKRSILMTCYHDTVVRQ